MQKVKIITDSCSDISREMAQEYNIDIVPLKVSFGEKTYKDFYDLTSDEFFTLMESTDTMPKTTMVTPGEFVDAFQRNIEKYEAIICITIGSKASGTHQSAMLAKEEFKERDIIIIDSKSLSFAYGYAVVMAARMAQEGKEANEIITYINNLLDKIDAYFIVHSLEYLRKGGRINLTQAVVGTILDVKPLLKVEEGLVIPYDRFRGKKNIISKIIMKFKKIGYSSNNIDAMTVLHGNMPELAQEFKNTLKDEFEIDNISISHVGSVIGAHSGPGILGCVIVKK